MSGDPAAGGGLLDLFDWRRRVADLYAEVRGTAGPGGDPEAAWRRWREVRDGLLRDHPQSPLGPEARLDFRGARYFPYDPAFRVLAAVEEDAEAAGAVVAGSAGSSFGTTRFATARFELLGGPRTLGLHWLEGYAGGVFLSFRDATSGAATYGAGRYLLDTAKAADLGSADDGRLVLDFNFAYQPSCAYDPRWACPLAPPENRMEVAVEAGERMS